MSHLIDGVLSQYDMAEMQHIIESAMTELATIRRTVRTPDGAGGYTTTLTTVATDVPVLRVAGIEGVSVTQVVGGQEAYGLRWELWMPHGTEVRDGDRIEIDDIDYEVIETATPATYMAGVLAYARKR